MPRRYWLMKSDPETFGWPELMKSPGKTTGWDGVRNYKARNYLRDEVQVGDGVLFYHSQVDKAVVGTAEVVRAAYPDPTQFDLRSDYHDPDSPKDAPRWFAVELKAKDAFTSPVTLDEMRTHPGLAGMELLRRGSRLSVTPVTSEQWTIVTKLGQRRS